MSPTAFVAFFGDMEHTFDLAKPAIVRELEAATGAGIGALCLRVIETRQFTHADLEHTLRLGLIGGGLRPDLAARIVANYLPMRPLVEAQVVAIGALSALWFGTEPIPEQSANGPVA